MFVPAQLLPDAQAGDLVVVTSTQPPVTRRGRVAERAQDASRGEFVRVSFD